MSKTAQKKIAAPVLGLASLACIVVGVVMLKSERADREIAETGESQPGSPFVAELGGRGIDLHGGIHQIEASDYPVIGSRDAEHVIVALWDYRAAHVRDHYQSLTRLQQAFEKNLAIVQLPASTDSEGVEIHRHMMLLRELDEAAFDTLAADIYAGRVEPKPASVLAEITRRVSTQRFADAHDEMGGMIEQRLQFVAKVQKETEKESGSKMLPQVVVGSEVAGGTTETSDYADLVGRVWGLTPDEGRQQLLEAAETPGLELSMETIDLGVVAPNSRLGANIPIKNAGETPLKVSWLRLQSGLEIKSMPSGDIAPGGTDEIQLILTVPAEGQHLESLVTVHTDGEEVGTTFKFYGRIEG